jgi:hypothetical protein
MPQNNRKRVRNHQLDFSRDNWLTGGGSAQATGTFAYLGLTVGGAVSIALTGNRQIQYTETTTYPCAATYSGLLTLPP